MLRNMIFHWPLLAFVMIVVTLMCVADMNWPNHMGGSHTMIAALGL